MLLLADLTVTIINVHLQLAQVTESLGVPRVYIKLLVELEDFLNKSLADKVGCAWDGT